MELKINKRIISYAMAVIMALGMLIWFVQKPAPQSSSLERLTLGVETSFLPAAVWVAADQGYFEQEGLLLSIKDFDSGKASFEAMLNHEGVDISTVAPTPIMFQSFKRDDFAIVATFAHSYRDLKVISHRNSGVAAVADLRGKKIGTPFGTTGQFFTDTFLTYNDIPSTEVELVDIPPSELGEALERREVDAIVIWEPYAYNAHQRLARNANILPSTNIYWETFNFMVMDGLIEEKPYAIHHFLRAIARATQFIGENKQRAQAIVAQRLGLDAEVVRALWDEFTFELALDQELVTTLEQEARWAIRNNLVDTAAIPNYLDYIHLDILKEVESGAVQIFH